MVSYQRGADSTLQKVVFVPWTTQGKVEGQMLASWWPGNSLFWGGGHVAMQERKLRGSSVVLRTDTQYSEVGSGCHLIRSLASH
jgi:hypothetical protein